MANRQAQENGAAVILSSRILTASGLGMLSAIIKALGRNISMDIQGWDLKPNPGSFGLRQTHRKSGRFLMASACVSAKFL